MKLIHISDLHFGLHNPALIECFLQDMAEIKPDIIIISGDLTQRAKPPQYQLLLSFLQRLPAVVLTVPGNHDIPLNNLFARLVYPFKNYKHYIASSFNNEFHNDKLRILGVNSVNPFRVKDGQLTRKIRQQIKDYFSPDFDGINIIFFHHNFDYMEGWHKPLENYRQFVDYLKASPIHIVCTGHLHYANVSVLEKNEEQSCLLLHAGSLLCLRSKDGLNSYYAMTIEQQSCQLQWRVFKQDGFEVFKQYSIDFNKKFSGQVLIERGLN